MANNNLKFGSGGRINKTISIESDNWQLIVHNEIKNVSGFINELIEDALTDKIYMKRLFVKKLTYLQQEALRLGFDLEFQLNETNKI